MASFAFVWISSKCFIPCLSVSLVTFLGPHCTPYLQPGRSLWLIRHSFSCWHLLVSFHAIWNNLSVLMVQSCSQQWPCHTVPQGPFTLKVLECHSLLHCWRALASAVFLYPAGALLWSSVLDVPSLWTLSLTHLHSSFPPIADIPFPIPPHLSTDAFSVLQQLAEASSSQPAGNSPTFFSDALLVVSTFAGERFLHIVPTGM